MTGLSATRIILGTDPGGSDLLRIGGNATISGILSLGTFGNTTGGMSLDSIGFFGVSRASAPSMLLNRYTTSGEICRFSYAGVTVGSVSTDGTSTTYLTTSDARLKNDLGLATDVSVLRKLKIHEFEWKKTGKLDRGFFAHEARKVKPSAVVTGEDDFKTLAVDYSKLVPDLIVGWQSHDARLAALEAKLASL